MRGRRAVPLRRGRERRLHDAGPASGTLGGGRFCETRTRGGTSSDSSCCSRSWSTAHRRELLLERCLGRLSARAEAAARAGGRHSPPQPGLPHRRLALDLRERPEAGLQGPAGRDRGHRIRDPCYHHRRGQHALRPLLRTDGALQPAHQVLRRRPSRLLHGDRDPEADAAGPALRHERGGSERHGVRGEILGRRGRRAREHSRPRAGHGSDPGWSPPSGGDAHADPGRTPPVPFSNRLVVMATRSRCRLAQAG